MSKLEKFTFEELISEATRRIHTGLLEGGSTGMQTQVHLWLDQAIRWSEVSKHSLRNTGWSEVSKHSLRNQERLDNKSRKR